MSSRRFQIILLTAAACLVGAAIAEARVISIDNPEWQRISQEERDKIVTDLKAKGILRPEDTVRYTGGKSTQPVQEDAGGRRACRLTRAICLRVTTSCPRCP